MSRQNMHRNSVERVFLAKLITHVRPMCTNKELSPIVFFTNSSLARHILRPGLLCKRFHEKYRRSHPVSKVMPSTLEFVVPRWRSSKSRKSRGGADENCLSYQSAAHTR